MKTLPAMFTVAAVLAGGYGQLAAAEYHVAPGLPRASDNNPGTAVRPWRSIAKAAGSAQPGDTVLLHAGTYLESVVVANAGTAEQPITFKALADQQVLMEGADVIPPEQWSLAPNTKSIYATALDHDPGQVLVDGKPIYVKLDPVWRSSPRGYRRGILTDADKNLYQYDPKARQLLLNLGGDAPARHLIRVPVRATAFELPAHCRLAGIRASHYLGRAIFVRGDDSLVEDCLVTDSGSGIVVAGWDRRGVIVRRNTIIGALGNGIYLVDRPTQCLVEDNLTIRCTLNPAREEGFSASIKMNSAADTIFAHNVVLEAGNPSTYPGLDGAALWGDINIVRVMYIGNTCANNKEAGLYVEYAMGDTRAYFNTCYRNGHGITCRQSQRGVFMWNLLLESRGSGLAGWAGDAPYSTTDNVFAHNLVRDCSPAIFLQTEHPNFADYNTYWPRKDGLLAQGQARADGKVFSCKDLAPWVQATGHDAHSKVQDAQPADVGLDTVTFRVADAKDPTQVLMMVGNGGCEYEDPVGQSVLPYFWRPGTGDDFAHKFSYAGFWGLEGGIDAMAYAGAGATVALPLDSQSDPKQPKLAHTGLRYLKINGQKPQDMCPDGLGFWSPTLPTRPGDIFDISFFVRGQDLKLAGLAPVAAFVDFADATAQHRQRVALPAGPVVGSPLSGTFDWTRLSAEVKVPAGSKRLRVFFGLAPATGTLLLDDISIKVR